MEGSHAREADYNESRRLIPTNEISLIYLRLFPQCEDANAAKFQALSPKGEEWALVYASFFPTGVKFFWFQNLNSPGNWILLHIKVTISKRWNSKNYKSKTGASEMVQCVVSDLKAGSMSLIPRSTLWEKRTDPHRVTSDLHTLTH